MAVIAEEGGREIIWSKQVLSPARGLDAVHPLGEGCLRIALVNNMPDAAIEDTEEQFLGLVSHAADKESLCVHAKLYSLSRLPRTEKARLYLEHSYGNFENLLTCSYDGVIVTGTEPKQADLRQEPYWAELEKLLDWAERNTASAILSCLAAHAAVLRSDGIVRSSLSAKQFGVFEHNVIDHHPLTQGALSSMCIPHSRWNDVREKPLCDCGYTVLTKSCEAGVDLFVKQKGDCLTVHFQGHPEYGSHTLLKEYRRDVKRYLCGEREDYPEVPRRYFDESATTPLNEFRGKAEASRRKETMAAFPEADIHGSLRNTWQESAVLLYRNWLKYLWAKKAKRYGKASASRAGHI